MATLRAVIYQRLTSPKQPAAAAEAALADAVFGCSINDSSAMARDSENIRNLSTLAIIASPYRSLETRAAFRGIMLSGSPSTVPGACLMAVSAGAR